MKLISLALTIARALFQSVWRAAPASVPAAASASGAVLATIAACGAIENRNALAPINDIAHIFYDEEAFAEQSSTCSARNLLRYTLPAIAWNTFALWGWAVGHEMISNHSNHMLSNHSRGRSRALSLGAGAMVSLVAYIVDYKLVSKRWTPGIEAHLSGKSLFAAYVALALGLALAPARKK